MIKKLTRHGNSLALIIDRGVLDLLEIEVRTPLRITTDGTRLVVTPVRTGRRGSALRSALREVNRLRGPALRKLAK
jgi:antitoxin MazE